MLPGLDVSRPVAENLFSRNILLGKSYYRRSFFFLKNLRIYECGVTFYIVFIFFYQAHFIQNLPMMSESALMLLRMVNLSFNEFNVSNESLISSNVFI